MPRVVDSGCVVVQICLPVLHSTNSLAMFFFLFFFHFVHFPGFQSRAVNLDKVPVLGSRPCLWRCITLWVYPTCLKLSGSPPVLPPTSWLSSTAPKKTLPGTSLSSGAPCSQPPLDSLISQRCAPKAELLCCLLLRRLHFLPRTNRTIQINMAGFYWE